MAKRKNSGKRRKTVVIAQPYTQNIKCHWRKRGIERFEKQLEKIMEYDPEKINTRKLDIRKALLNIHHFTKLSPDQKKLTGTLIELTKREGFGKTELQDILGKTCVLKLDLKE